MTNLHFERNFLFKQALLTVYLTVCIVETTINSLCVDQEEPMCWGRKVITFIWLVVNQLFNCHALLQKLADLQVNPCNLRWIGSYLLDRSQAVILGGVQSSTLHVVSGVPQVHSTPGITSQVERGFMKSNQAAHVCPMFYGFPSLNWHFDITLDIVTICFSYKAKHLSP